MTVSRNCMWLLIGLWVLLFIQCDREKDIVQLFDKYPTSLGNQWMYDYFSQFIPYDSNGIPNPQETISFSVEVYVEIDDEDFLLNDTLRTIRLVSYSLNSTARKAYGFYTNDTDGLLHHASQGVSYPVLAKKSEISIIPEFTGMPEFPFISPTSWINISSDSIFVFNPPNKSLHYPPSVNSTWSFVNNNFVEIHKSIIGITDVDVPAGKFECYEVKYIYIRSNIDSSQSVVNYEYYAKEGLIKRTSTHKNILLVNPTGDIFGAGDAEITSELKEYSIK